MRKVILMMQVSLDGFFEGPEHDLSWHRVDEGLHRHFNDELRTMGAFLDGRVTYELMAGFWPMADQNPSSTAVEAEFAGICRDMPKIVYSRTLASAGWKTEVVHDVVAEEVARLKAAPAAGEPHLRQRCGASAVFRGTGHRTRRRPVICCPQGNRSTGLPCAAGGAASRRGRTSRGRWRSAKTAGASRWS